MEIFIEEYRGFEIYFNKETQNFYTISNRLHVGDNENSYLGTKSFIDDLIKDNTKFEPFYIVNTNDDLSRKMVIGVRKDNGSYIVINTQGKKVDLKVYNEKFYIIENEINILIIDKIREELNNIKASRSRIDEYKKSIKETLADVNKYKF